MSEKVDGRSAESLGSGEATGGDEFVVVHGVPWNRTMVIRAGFPEFDLHGNPYSLTCTTLLRDVVNAPTQRLNDLAANV